MAITTFVGIAEMKISIDPAEILSAPNLGSCLGVAVYDPIKKIGGMVHCLLPSSSSDLQKAKLNPCMYVDTGVARLLEQALKNGAEKRNLTIAVAGGSAISDINNVFEIGKKNFTVLRKLLWKNNLLLEAEDVGGDHSRTISLHIESGEMWLKAKGELRKMN